MAKRRTNKQPVSSDEEAFHSAVIEHPDDDTVRLVYADWLDEHGQRHHRRGFTTMRSTIGIEDNLFARWVAAGDRAPRDVLDPLGLSPRLTRLFAVAVCLDMWEFLADERSRTAVEVAERFADGRATVRERRVAHKAARDAYFDLCAAYGRDPRPAAAIPSLAASTARDAVDTHARAGRAADYAAMTAGKGLAGGDRAARLPVRERQGRLLATIVGPGYGLLPEWHTTDAVALARACYETKDWSIMPYLADAMQEAGCENEDVLDHCRGSGPHVRGDWVLDSLLGLN